MNMLTLRRKLADANVVPAVIQNPKITWSGVLSATFSILTLVSLIPDDPKFMQLIPEHYKPTVFTLALIATFLTRLYKAVWTGAATNPTPVVPPQNPQP